MFLFTLKGVNKTEFSRFSFPPTCFLLLTVSRNTRWVSLLRTCRIAMQLFGGAFSPIINIFAIHKLYMLSGLSMVKKQSRLDVRKFPFPQTTISVWNKLSTDCVHASSVICSRTK